MAVSNPPSGWDCHVHVFAAHAKAAPGHYAPQDHPLERIESAAAQHGFGHLVLVQPSVYGSDNSLMLTALQASGGRHRGVVVVVDELLPHAQLKQWHEWGVRGIRCNLVSPVGHRSPDWSRWAPMLRELGWHVQWYAHGDQLGDVLRWQDQHGLTCVLDHVAGMHTRFAQDAQAWANLRTLASAGAWIKLSGWYRLGLGAPYDLQALQISRVVESFGARTVWGSDWPHTSFAPDQAPQYCEVWEPLAALRARQLEQLSANALGLYSA